MDYLRLILQDLFTHFTPNSILTFLTSLFLLILQLFIPAIMALRSHLNWRLDLLSVNPVSASIVMPIVSAVVSFIATQVSAKPVTVSVSEMVFRVFIAASWADSIMDFWKVSATLSLTFMAALKASPAIASATVRVSAIVMGSVTVSSETSIFF